MAELNSFNISAAESDHFIMGTSNIKRDGETGGAKLEREREREAARLLDISKRERREEEMRAKKALKLASQKNIRIFDDERVLNFAIEDQIEFDKVLSIFAGLNEVNLDLQKIDENVILSWEDLKDQKVYAPLNLKRLNVEILRAEILNLAKSKAELSAKSHLYEHFNLNSTGDVEYMGSEIELRASNRTILGGIDTLFRIRSRNMFILMERKTSVGVNATASLEDQVGVPMS